MTSEKKRPNVDEFMSDPKFGEERDFLAGVFDRMMADKIEAARKAEKEKGGSFIDNLFNFFGEDGPADKDKK